MAINNRNGSTLLESGFFPPCRVTTTGSNNTLSGLQTIDGIVLLAGDRVLVKDQTDATTNGIYAASTGAWVRTSDAAGSTQFFQGMAVVIATGTNNAGITYVCTCADDPVVIGTSLLTFASQTALQQAQTSAQSTTSATIGTGAKTFTVPAAKQFTASLWVLIYELSNIANTMLAQITSYAGTSLAVNVVATGGSGTHADWGIALTSSPATYGLIPPTGTGNVTGAGSSVAGNLATFADTTGKVLADSGKAPGTLATRTTTLYGDIGAGSVPAAGLAAGAAPLPFVAVQTADNLALSNDGTNPNTDIQITAGRVRDDSDATNLQLAATMLKRIDTAWAAGGLVGTRKGMLLTGSSWLASKTYHLWLIGALSLSVTQFARTSNVATLTITGHPLGVGGTLRVIGVGSGFDGVAAITAVGANSVSYANTGADVGTTSVTAVADGFDIGATQQDAQAYPAATLPTGFTLKQCLGSIITDGSKNVLAFTQYGNEFWWTSPPLDVNSAGASDTTRALTVPLGVKVQAIVEGTVVGSAGGTTTAQLYLSSPDQTDTALGSANATIGAILVNAAGNISITSLGGGKRVWTSTAAAIRANSNAFNFNLRTIGWYEPRRRLF